jgi:hypothetical protein
MMSFQKVYSVKKRSYKSGNLAVAKQAMMTLDICDA